MTVTELIAALEKVLKEHGDVIVEVTGCYGSTGSLIKVYEDTEVSVLGKVIYIETDLCSG